MDNSRKIQRGLSFSQLDPVLMESRLDRKIRREEKLLAKAVALKEQGGLKKESFEATTISPAMSTRMRLFTPHCPDYPLTPGPVGAKYVAPRPKKWLKSMRDMNAKYVEDLKFCKFNTLRLPEPPNATKLEVKTGSSSVTLTRRLSVLSSSLRAGGTSASGCSLVNQKGVPDSKQDQQQRTRAKKHEEAVLNLNMQAVNFVCKDMRPIKILEGAGFKELAQTLIDMGAKYGRLNIEDFLLPRNVLTESILNREFHLLRSMIALEIKTFMNKQTVAFTADLWTSCDPKTPYLSLSCHLVDGNMKIKNYLVSLEPMPMGTKTSDHLRSIIFCTIKKGLCMKNSELATMVSGKKLAFVTGNGKNVAKALEDFKRIDSADVCINSVLEYFFETLAECNELNIMIKNCMDLVEYVKRAKLNGKLNFELKPPPALSCIPTVLEAIYSGFEDLQKVLQKKSELHRIGQIDKSKLLELIRLLKPFEIAAEELSVTDTATLHLVLPWKLQIEKSLAKQSEDSLLVTLAKEILLEGIKTCFKCDELHQIATFLDPRMKQLKNIYPNETERKKVYNKIKKIILVKYNETDSKESAVPEGASTGSLPVSLSSTSTIHSLFDNPPKVEDASKDEFKRYLNLEVSATEHLDVLQFWNEYKEQFPKICKLARDVLVIPASLACSEKSFGLTAQALRKRIKGLKKSNVSNILFVNYNCCRD